MSLPPEPLTEGPGSATRPAGTLVPRAAAPSLQVGATLARFVATGDLTEGRYGLFRWEMSGASGGAPPHVHRTFSEAFYVLEGTVTVYDDRAWHAAHPGDFLYVPPDGAHGFRNDSGQPATMLILFAPGPPREEYFRELAERIASGRRYTPAEHAAFMARYDQYEVPGGA
jgi:quercetin dioxygenase-like cupin family protein